MVRFLRDAIFTSWNILLNNLVLEMKETKYLYMYMYIYTTGPVKVTTLSDGNMSRFQG